MNEKSLNKEKNKNEGITLIALVITIIVLLILAGVVIATLTGDNGILTNANKAKDKMSAAEEKEKIQLAYQSAKMTDLQNGTDTVVKNLQAQLIADGVTGATVSKMGTSGALVTMPSGRKFKVTSNGEISLSSTEIYEDGDYKVKIPEGCEVSEKDGEKHVDTGLVIIDSSENEWVFVPCTISEYSTATNQKGTWKSWEYTNKTWNDSAASTIGLASLGKLAEDGLTTGFYVSRYEAGIPESASFYANTNGASYTGASSNGNDATKERNTTTIAPVSKKGAQAWNCISQTKAKEIAQLMYTGEEGQSYLIDSYAWDTICKRMIAALGSDSSKVTSDSTTIGNYYNTATSTYSGLTDVLYAVHTHSSGWTKASTYSKGSISGAPGGSGNNRLELATGSLECAKINNIYDIAGNMWEWTTEESTNGYAVLRGGGFHNIGSGYPAVFRNGSNLTSSCVLTIGFRAVLYL